MQLYWDSRYGIEELEDAWFLEILMFRTNLKHAKDSGYQVDYWEWSYVQFQILVSSKNPVVVDD